MMDGSRSGSFTQVSIPDGYDRFMLGQLFEPWAADPIWQFPGITEFMLRHHVPLESIVSHRLSLDDATDAFKMLRERRAEKMVFEL